MNFLAHFHLAWPHEGLIAGGLEGDFYKGPLRGEHDAELERGVALHRAVDAYTDSHPRIVQLREQFPAGLRRYAGILIDVSFDHYLTRHWSQYSSIELKPFTQAVYRALSTHEHQLSSGSRVMLSRMLQYDTLNAYHDWQAVPATAERIGERFTRGNPLLGVEQDLEPVRDQLEQAFHDFYPQLVNFAESQRKPGN
ncbi:MAG: ACP phosphodiesterase [Halioglobus sp.]